MGISGIELSSGDPRDPGHRNVSVDVIRVATMGPTRTPPRRWYPLVITCQKF